MSDKRRVLSIRMFKLSGINVRKCMIDRRAFLPDEMSKNSELESIFCIVWEKTANCKHSGSMSKARGKQVKKIKFDTLRENSKKKSQKKFSKFKKKIPKSKYIWQNFAPRSKECKQICFQLLTPLTRFSSSNRPTHHVVIFSCSRDMTHKATIAPCSVITPY